MGGGFVYIIVKKKHIIIAVLCCLAAALLVPLSFSHFSQESVPAAASANTNWGLSFPKEGGTPTGNASAEALKKYNSYYIGDTSKKVIYLTFDAGFENGCTPSILDTLKKHNVKAAFFVVGNYIQTSPDLIKRMVEEGHIVGNHTFHHPDMSKISEQSAFQEELNSLEKIVSGNDGAGNDKILPPSAGKIQRK